MYRGTSGLWQSVYTESFPESALKHLFFFPQKASVVIRWALEGASGEAARNLTISLRFSSGQTFAFPAGLKSARLPADFPEWSPEKPKLVLVEAELKQGDKALDRVTTYFGYRVLEIKRGRIFLNGKPLFQNFCLVQGYYPGGWATGTLEQMEEDVDSLRKMGYNGLRLHQKIEDPRFLSLCDKKGFFVWEEMPSFYRYRKGETERTFLSQWKEVLERDSNHPSIIAWVPFNE